MAQYSFQQDDCNIYSTREVHAFLAGKYRSEELKSTKGSTAGRSRMVSDAEGHVLGNFHAYYSFNPVHERLRFMDARTSRALREALLLPREEGDASAATVVDIGCNEGKLVLPFAEYSSARLLIRLPTDRRLTLLMTLLVATGRRLDDRLVQRAHGPATAAGGARCGSGDGRRAPF